MAIDREETKNSLFGGFQKSVTSKVKEFGSSGKKTEVSKGKLVTPKLPKWKTLEKVTVLLSSEQKDLMDDVARRLMRFRQKEGSSDNETERITANSVVRGILDNPFPGFQPHNVRDHRKRARWIYR